MFPEQSEWRDELLGELLNPPDKAHLQLPLILSRREIARVLACPRHSLIWRVLYGTGMRPHEYFQVEFREDGQIQLPDRMVILDPETWTELKANPPQGNLPKLLAAWSETAASIGLDRKFAGIGRPLHPQSLRHAFASHRLEDGMDLISLYYQLGHRLINTTKIYIRTALRQNQREYQSTHPLCRPQLVRTPQAHLTIADVLALLQAHKKPQARLTLRTFYASALRLAELQTLVGADLTAEENRLFVRCGKDSIDRYVLIDTTTAQLLRQLARAPEQPLLEPVAERTLRNWITQAAQTIGILEKYQAAGFTISPHGLRHAYASHCYQQGMTPHCLRELLGHSWLQDTLIYAHCPLEFRQQVAAQTHPLR